MICSLNVRKCISCAHLSILLLPTFLRECLNKKKFGMFNVFSCNLKPKSNDTSMQIEAVSMTFKL